MGALSIESDDKLRGGILFLRPSMRGLYWKLARHLCGVNASDLLCYRMLLVGELWTVTEIEFPVHWLMVSDVQ